jgi:hypothetical protein
MNDDPHLVLFFLFFFMNPQLVKIDGRKCNQSGHRVWIFSNLLFKLLTI